eukprot:gene7020-11185_t
MTEEVKKPPFWKNLTAGTAGGMSLTLVGHPLDTIKVRLQTMPKPGPGELPLYTSSTDCAKKTIAKEGPLGLYKGVTSPMLGSAALYAVQFASYGWGKKIFGDSSPFQLFNAGCFSGVLSTVVMTPMELIKVQLQTQKEGVKKYNGAFDCGKKIFQERGIQGIYKGTVSTLARDVPGSGIYFAAYEIVKRAFIPKDGTAADLNSFHTLFAGGMAGLTGWIYMLPADTVKSRIQSAEAGKYSGMMDCVRQLIKTEGYGAFYRGIGPVFLRSFPANAACFFGFETAMKLLNKITN